MELTEKDAMALVKEGLLCVEFGEYDEAIENYDYSVQLLINERLQITHMAIESTRLAANKTLEKTTGQTVLVLRKLR